jgi:hypothetical protein
MRSLNVILAILVAASLTGQERRQLSLNDGGDLELVKREKDNLAGTFRTGGRTAKFQSAVSDEKTLFELWDSKDNQVLRITSDKDHVDVLVLGDAIHVTAERPRGVFALVGERVDQQALSRFLANEAYTILPNLAIELFRRQIFGTNFPAAQFLHGIGVVSAEAQGLQMPDPGKPDERPIQPASFLFSGCTDLSQKPYQYDCYGMCGNSCTCWWPVCGTCCGCDGCLTHDYFCRMPVCPAFRQLSASDRLAYRTACVTFAGFRIPLQPCNRYKGPRRKPPCP